MMEIRIGYPTPEQEEEIVLRTTAGMPELPSATFEREEFVRLHDVVLAVPVAQNVAGHAVRLCGVSRPEDPAAAVYSRLRGVGCRSPRFPESRAGGQGPRLLLGRRPRPPRTFGAGPAHSPSPNYRQSPGRRRLDHLGQRRRAVAERSGRMSTRVTSRFLDLQRCRRWNTCVSARGAAWREP